MERAARTQNARHALGQRAEARVADWLGAHGWRILGRRARQGGGELDLVAIDPIGVLVGVEVRARRSERAGSPAETLSPRGIARRRRALAAYAAHAPPHHGIRLDLVSVVPAAGGWRLSRLAGIDAP
jgi:putative endonuclease